MILFTKESTGAFIKAHLYTFLDKFIIEVITVSFVYDKGFEGRINL